jgi:hypothetical protein
MLIVFIDSIEDGTQPSSSQHKVSTGAIVGGVVGGLVVVSTLSLLLFFRQRHNSRGSVIITNRDGVAEGPGGHRDVLESARMLEHASMSPSLTEDIPDTAGLGADLESLGEVELL